MSTPWSLDSAIGRPDDEATIDWTESIFPESLPLRNLWPCAGQKLLTSLPLVMADVLGLGMAVLLGSLASDWVLGVGMLGRQTMMFALPVCLVATFTFFGCYPAAGVHPVFELRQTLVALLAVLTIFSIASGIHYYPNGVLVGLSLAFLIGGPACILIPLLRAAVRQLCSRFRWWGIPVVMIGCGGNGESMAQVIQRRKWKGLRLMGVIDEPHVYWRHSARHDGPPLQGPPLQGLPLLGSPGEVRDFAERHNVFTAIINLPGNASPAAISHMIKRMSPVFPHQLLVTNLYNTPSLWNESCEIGGHACISFTSRLYYPIPQLTKRTTDVLIVLAMSIVLLPLLVLIALLVKTTSPGPVFYRQERRGRRGQPFFAWKFRTMVDDASEVLESHLAEHSELRREWKSAHKLAHDPRTTRFGRWLRKASLDELPQLWNVLRGDMSLVGPRPIVEEEIEKYADMIELYRQVRPGITGLWQISGRNNTTYAERVLLDSYYVRNWSVWLDLYILVRTVKTVLLCEGAY